MQKNKEKQKLSGYILLNILRQITEKEMYFTVLENESLLF